MCKHEHILKCIYNRKSVLQLRFLFLKYFFPHKKNTSVIRPFKHSWAGNKNVGRELNRGLVSLYKSQISRVPKINLRNIIIWIIQFFRFFYYRGTSLPALPLYPCIFNRFPGPTPEKLDKSLFF